MDLKDKINALIVQLEEVSERLYKQDSESAYILMADAIGLLAEVIDQMYTMRLQNGAIEFDENILRDKLAEALNAMEINDKILMADILRYEIVEELSKFNSQLL